MDYLQILKIKDTVRQQIDNEKAEEMAKELETISQEDLEAMNEVELNAFMKKVVDLIFLAVPSSIIERAFKAPITKKETKKDD